MTVPYSNPRLNELPHGFWVIEVTNYLGNKLYLHDPDLKTVSGFDGAYRYSSTGDDKTILRHYRAFKKRHGDFVTNRGPFMFIKPRYVNKEFAARINKN